MQLPLERQAFPVLKFMTQLDGFIWRHRQTWQLKQLLLCVNTTNSHNMTLYTMELCHEHRHDVAIFSNLVQDLHSWWSAANMIIWAVVNDKKWPVPPPLNKLIWASCVLRTNDAIEVMIQLWSSERGLLFLVINVTLRFLSERSFSHV